MTFDTGYLRDADTVFYVTKSGVTYLVYEPEAVEPMWKKCSDPGEEYLSPDAETARLCAEERAEFEKVRLAYGIED
jgi:hypothetical protein